MLQQDGDRVVGRGYKLSENGVAVPEEQRTALELEGHVEGKQLVLTFVERGGGSYNSGWIRWAITPDGRKLYVANGRSGSVSVIDTEKNQKVTDIPVGSLPWGVVIR